MTQLHMKGEATSDFVGHMESMLGDMPSAPSLGNSVLALQDGAVEDKGKRNKGRASAKSKAKPEDDTQPVPDDEKTKTKLPKDLAEAKLLEAMVANPPEYIRQWQKSIITDLGTGTTLVEQLQLQALVAEMACLQ